MAHAHPLDGLMKWAERDHWAEELAWVLEQHFGPTCEELGVEMDRLPELLGEEHLMNLWGCAFEDLVARDIDGHNIADEYLKRRGWKESASTRAYIRALRQSVVSLYEVSEIRRDQGFLARDLMRGGDPLWINEKSGTHYLAPWDRIAARVVTVNGKIQMTGGLLRFERELSDDLMAELKDLSNTTSADLARRMAEFVSETGDEADDETRAIIDALQTAEIEMTMDRALASSAFMFTTFWLRDALGRVLNPRLPQLINSDREPIEWIEMRYPLAGATSVASLRRALAGIPGLRQDGKNFWNWFEKREHGKPGGADGARQMIISRLDDGTTVLGNLELARRTLTVTVNSDGRMARIRALVEPALGALVGAPAIERQNTEELLANKRKTGRRGGQVPGSASGMSAEERTAITQAFLDSHYAHTLDDPVPALGGVTPRSAANSETGRPKVVDWLKGLENSHARAAQRDPAQEYDCSWMWDELGLGHYRRRA
jgi:hypothetical protein